MTAWNVSMNFTSAGAALSATLVEAEAEQAERTEQALESEKSRIREAAEAEYEANLEAAEDMERAAWIGGAFAIASGSLSVYGAATSAGTHSGAETSEKISGAANQAREEAAAAARTSRTFESLGAALGHLTPTARGLGGEIAAERERAEAQHIGRTIDQAQVEADQLAERLRRSEQRAESAISQAGSFVEGENSRANGVLSNF